MSDGIKKHQWERQPLFPCRAGGIPPGFWRCEDCGEFRGTTKEKYLAPSVVSAVEPNRLITVTCLCEGPLCRECGVSRTPRPMSERYHLETNSVWYRPHFYYALSCAKCRERRRVAEEQKLNQKCQVGSHAGPPEL